MENCRFASLGSAQVTQNLNIVIRTAYRTCLPASEWNVLHPSDTEHDAHTALLVARAESDLVSKSNQFVRF